MFLSGSHGTSLGKIKTHLWFWLSQPIGTEHRKTWLKAINILAGGEENDHVVDPAVASAWQPIFAAAAAFRGAPDPVPQRWHFIKGVARTVAVPPYEELEKIVTGKRRLYDPGSSGAGGATGGWRGASNAWEEKRLLHPTIWESGCMSDSSAPIATESRSMRSTTR